MYYLRKYVGKYRVKADYDLDTKDYPRLDNGSIDPSFDDLYIDCKNNIKIRHGVGNVLSCYIPSKTRGVNIIRKIFEDYVSESLPKEKSKYSDNLCKKLIENSVLVDVDVLDFEVYFTFKSDMVDYIASLVDAKTSGANTNPFSTKNLPKKPYKIPDEDMKLYKESIKNFPTKTVVVNGKERKMIDGLLIKSLNSEFDKVIAKSQPKGFDVSKDRKLKGLKGKDYIHSMGSEMWKEYCNFLKEHGNK